MKETTWALGALGREPPSACGALPPGASPSICMSGEKKEILSVPSP